MEVRKISKAMRKGVLSSFEVPEIGDMECGNIQIDEFFSHYEVIMEKEEKMDQFDLASILFDFINSNFFSKEKYFLFGKNKICFNAKEDYNVIFSKIKPLLKKLFSMHCKNRSPQ